MKYLLAFLALALSVLSVRAGDWTQFRGSDGTAISEETGLPIKWSATENVRWKVDLPGRGLSSPIVAGGRVFVTASTGPGKIQNRMHVLCFDEATGKQLWQRTLAATGDINCHPMTNMAAPTPATDGKRVFALFATCDLACFSADGDLLWYRSLSKDYPGLSNQVGMASSPLLYKDTLLVDIETPGESFAAGLDANTGKNVWKLPRTRDVCWTSPALTTIGGKPAAMFQSEDNLSAYNPTDGKLIWSYQSKKLAKIASAAIGKDLIVVPGDGAVALRPLADKPTPEEVWGSAKLQTSMASPVVYRDRYFGVNKVGVLICADLTEGKIRWQERLKGAFSATPLAADGKLYLTNEEGTTFVLKLGDEKPELLSTNALGETILASPAAANGALFLRSDQHLYCIAAKKDEK
jgi:outer membrane protein assembly factor BamB